jgi:hypothetical protein
MPGVRGHVKNYVQDPVVEGVRQGVKDLLKKVW